VDLFLLRLTGSAFSWAQALPDTENDTLEHIGAAFEARYMPKDMMKFRFAKEIYDNKQGETQSVDDYILKLRKQGGLAGLNETAQVFAALNGLRPHLTEYVIDHDHGYATLDELIKNARTAELKRNVCPPIERDSDAVVSCKLGAMESKLDNFMSEMRKNRTLANMSDDVERGRDEKRVSFARPESRPTSPGVQTRSPSTERREFQPSRFQPNRQFRPEGQQGGGFSQGRGGGNFRSFTPHFTPRPQAQQTQTSYQQNQSYSRPGESYNNRFFPRKNTTGGSKTARWAQTNSKHAMFSLWKGDRTLQSTSLYYDQPSVPHLWKSWPFLQTL